MIRVTSHANKYLRQVREAKGIESTAGARFVRSPGGIGVTFATAPAPGDQVVGAKDLTLYIPDDLAAALANSIIDVSSENGNSRLVLRPQ
jgi:Fe-S cluster assembly iron-binding protein IscA